MMRARSLLLQCHRLESREVPASPSAAPSLGPPPPPSANVVWVSTVTQLQSAVQNLQPNRTIIIQPGVYQITSPLYVGLSQPVSNVTIRGATDNFDDVMIRGAGMDSTAVPHGFSVYNAQDVTIANLSIGQVYYHAIDLQGGQGADRVHVYHCRVFDSGEQLVKGNPAGGNGADDCTVQYSVLEYTNGPSTVDHGPGVGYTNAISALGVAGWQVRHNLVRNLHTPDSAAYLWNPAFLFWGNSRDTLIEGNTFIDCDRAIATGLQDNPGFDHQNGVVRNNFVYQRPGLFSAARRAASDTQIAINDSPGTQVYNNTVLTSGNSVVSIEVRWGNTGIVLANNLADAPLRTRNGGAYTGTGNYLTATPAMFVNPAAGDLHVVDSAATRANVIDRATASPANANDFDIGPRPVGSAPDVGADEFSVEPPRVQSVTVGDGTAQRSRVARLVVTFDQQVTFAGSPAAAFTLVRDGGTVVNFTATPVVTGSQTVVTLNAFSGPATQSGSLADGRYTLAIVAGQVSANGLALDGDGDGTPGGTFTSRLHRLFGDADGDADTDVTDFAAFRGVFGTANTVFDIDGDGDADTADFAAFRQRFGSAV